MQGGVNPVTIVIWKHRGLRPLSKAIHTYFMWEIIYVDILYIYIQRYTTSRHTSNERADHGCTGTTHYNSLIRTTLSHRHNKDRTWSYLTESGAGGLGASYLLVTLPLLPADAAAAGGRHRELCNKNRTSRRRHGRRSRESAYPGYTRQNVTTIRRLYGSTTHIHTTAGANILGPDSNSAPQTRFLRRS